MANIEVNLKGYDIVVAVTQQSINESIANYLYQIDKQVDLYYTVDSKGELVRVASEDKASYVFTGILDYAEQSGKPIPIVTLHVPGEPQMIHYNITFRKATFYSKTEPKFKLEQTEEDEPWVIRLRVSLALQEAELEKLPEKVREKIKKYVQNLSPDMFSIQQLYVDLNTAVFDEFQGMQGMTSFAQGVFTAIIKDYIQIQKNQGDILFGIGITHASSEIVPAATFLPTALNFCITPYQDSTGAAKPELDTLNYLVMTQNHISPRDIPQSFDFNWVEDESDHGVMAIRRELIIPFITDQLNPILAKLCPKIKVSAQNRSIELLPNEAAIGFKVLPRSSHPNVARADYEVTDDDSYSTPLWQFWDIRKIDAVSNYSMTCVISLPEDKNNIIHINGSIIADLKFVRENLSIGGGLDKIEMPKTIFDWSVDLVLRMDLSQKGQLDLTYKNDSFESKPKVEQKHETFWEEWCRSVSGSTQIFAEELGGMRAAVKSHIVDHMVDSLNETLKSANAFIFPGGNTFLFKKPIFCHSGDLTSTITYLLPTV